MESVPAIFAGTAFALFGAGLLGWTGVRVGQRAPVAHGVDQRRAAVATAVCGVACLLLGVWCFGRV
ncbi:hypothetical protein [Streptomyces clavuligerus]|uniref:Uncharacterized protein n=1 Tax=Streptomyces clavuligerus TaxID=1901 RepID=B5GPP1_STRCL|nr:hypothetical protein [Streptomyces clavuligerus]ANW19577.1 hypothetical protein BB341_15805 [Streptomyces clavuligerus]AXU14183.1 hypothetical protein D1794_16485 [Streptomyces clavuligerus]EDY48287.1 hypothetical protein SSCG_01568 [Streptomyces clavuligerus]EFG07608.1 Hypothetical protein SCLAV_2536 [Streptomyces clavuligerus]MBY6304181.1 hypothetical protein [Streptomyces clavuligerus]